jgi:hypothetical protein
LLSFSPENGEGPAQRRAADCGRARASDSPESAVETDIRKLVILVVGALVAIPILLFAVDFVLPPEEATVAKEQLPELDPAVTAQSLAYLTRKSDVGKVVIQGIQVFIGFNAKPKNEELAAIVNEAALKYAAATGREIYVHGTRLEQMASIGTPSFGEYCTTRAGVGLALGDDGKTFNKPVMLESTC